MRGLGWQREARGFQAREALAAAAREVITTKDEHTDPASARRSQEVFPCYYSIAIQSISARVNR